MTSSWNELLNALESGKTRSADPSSNWKSNVEVKQAILDAFKAGKLVEMPGGVDKDSLTPRTFSPEQKVRVVPQGQSVRRGAFVAEGVIIMPPSYVNIGAFVDSGSMIDSHVLVGSCAQVGKNVHLSAAVQLGGVLEPIGSSPVVIEDDAFIGAGCSILEGRRVGRGAVLAAGVILSKGTPVYDCVHGRLLDPGEAIPENAVVIPGTRPLGGAFAKEHGLSASCALIVKLKDDKTSASTTLEQVLR